MSNDHMSRCDSTVDLGVVPTINAPSARKVPWVAFFVFGMALLMSSCGVRSQPADRQKAATETNRVAIDDQPQRPAHLSIDPPDSDVAPTPRAPRDDDWFENVTPRSGVQFSYRNGREGEKYTILESVGGGVALIDYDVDGDLDLFITGGGTIGGSPTTVAGLPSVFYRNDGEWKFVDVTAAAGLATASDYSIGCSCGDFDRDGYPDLFVTGYPRSRLLRNTGKGRFEDVTDRLGLNVEGLHAASTWPDVDNDGWPDLFVTGYVTFDLKEGRKCGDELRKIKDICGIWQYPSAPDRLFLNRGGKAFEDVSQQAGIRADGKGRSEERR